MIGCGSNWREIAGQRVIAGDLWHPIPRDHGVAIVLRVWIEIVGRELGWKIGVGILARIVRSREGRREGLCRGPSFYFRCSRVPRAAPVIPDICGSVGSGAVSRLEAIRGHWRCSVDRVSL
jgi:hypothetical protein